MAAITIHPAQLDRAASAVGDRVMAATRAATKLHGLDVGVEMPPGIQGRVKASVDRAATALTSSVARIGSLSSEMLARSGQAREADQIGKAFGGLLQAAGIKQASLALGGNAAFAASALPADTLRWVNRAGVGLPVAGAAAAGIFSWAKHRDNPFLTAGQKREQVAGETTTSITKTAVTTGASLAAGGAAVGMIGGPPGSAVGAAGGFVAGLAAGVVVGVGTQLLDKKFGITQGFVDDLGEASDDVGTAWEWSKQANDDAVDWVGTAGGDAKEWGGNAVDDVAGGAKDAIGGFGRGLAGRFGG